MGVALKHLNESDRISIARNLFNVTAEDQHKGELHGLCPIHNEKNPSFSYNYKTDVFGCFSCGAGGDLIALWTQINDHDTKEGFKAFCAQYGIPLANAGNKTKSDADPPSPPSPPPPPLIEQAFEQMPPVPDHWLGRLKEKYGWTKATLERLNVRLQTMYQPKGEKRLVKIRQAGRLAFPVFDTAGKLQNIRLYKPDAKKKKIVSWSKGHGKTRLFPAAPLEPTGPVLLCEGEKDTITAISHGFNAITQTAKTKYWPEEHLEPLRGREVIIAYDADQAGQRYAGYAADCIHRVAASVRLLQWPDIMGRLPDGKWPEKKGDDLTDYLNKLCKTARDLQELFATAPFYEPPEETARVSTAGQFFDYGLTGKYTFKPRLLAERILKDIRLAADPESGLVYKWNSRFWEPYPHVYIERDCLKYLGEESQTARAKDAANQVRVLSLLPFGRQFNDRIQWSCIQNGMLNLKALDLIPHSPDYFTTFELGVRFDPKAEMDCKRWKQFLGQTVQTPEAIAQMQEFVGCCLTRDTRFAKCLLCIGPGSDGKSIFLKTLRKLVGDQNCSSIAFEDLEDKFMRAGLYNKLLNISTEVGSKALESPHFKAIVTGDPIQASFKFRDSFDFIPFCKLAFATNRLPRVLDNSDGLFRRIMPVSFKRQFLEGDPDRDPHLEEKLEAELSGIFEWAIVGLHRLWENKGFTDCAETRGLIQDYRRLNNPILCYVEDHCSLGAEQRIKKDELYQDYRSYCGKNGYSPHGREGFFRELKAAVNNLKETRPRQNGKRSRVFEGIGLEVKFDDE